MTGRMKAQIEREGGGEVQITGRVEGPYGVKKDLRGKDAVIIFAGKSSHCAHSKRGRAADLGRRIRDFFRRCAFTANHRR